MTEPKVLRLSEWAAEILADKTTSIFWLHGGLGSGKTLGEVFKHYNWILDNQNCPYSWFVEPTYHKIETIAIPAWRFLFDLLNAREGLHYEVLSSKPQKIKVRTGNGYHTILCHSGDRWRLMVGDNIGYYTIDEAAEVKAAVYERCEDRKRDRKVNYAQACIGGAPQGLNWFADIANYDGYNAELNHKSYELWTQDNAHNLRDGYVEDLLKRYGHNKAKIESYLFGRFTSFHEGQAYSEYNATDDRHTTEADPHVPITASWDFNVQPLAWTAFQKRRVEDLDYVGMRHLSVGESSGKSSLLIDGCVEFIVKFPPKVFANTPIRIQGDASGYQRSVRARGNNYEEIQKYLKQYYKNVTIIAPKFNPPVAIRVEFVNKAFSYNLLQIHERDVNTSRSLINTIWKPGSRELHKPGGDELTHWGDEVGYYIFNELKEDESSRIERPKVIF